MVLHRPGGTINFAWALSLYSRLFGLSNIFPFSSSSFLSAAGAAGGLAGESEAAVAGFFAAGDGLEMGGVGFARL